MGVLGHMFLEHLQTLQRLGTAPLRAAKDCPIAIFLLRNDAESQLLLNNPIQTDISLMAEPRGCIRQGQQISHCWERTTWVMGYGTARVSCLSKCTAST